MRTLLILAALLSAAAAAPPVESAAGTGETASPITHPTLDLGAFRIDDLRPASNEIAKLTFAMHLVVSPSLTKSQAAQLEHWQHRLRDQVHTAIRTLEIKDFQEPSLERLRRKVLLRVNRLFQAKVIDEVLLTEYLFHT